VTVNESDTSGLITYG